VSCDEYDVDGFLVSIWGQYPCLLVFRSCGGDGVGVVGWIVRWFWVVQLLVS